MARKEINNLEPTSVVPEARQCFLDPLPSDSTGYYFPGWSDWSSDEQGPTEGKDSDDLFVGGCDGVTADPPSFHFFWGRGDDSLTRNVSDDLLVVGRGSDLSLGGDGEDSIYGDHTNVTEQPTPTSRLVISEAPNPNFLVSDTIDGGDGDDTVIAGSGNNAISGGAGRDTLEGGCGLDLNECGSINDSLHGGYHHDTLQGGDWGDLIFGDEWHDFIDGGDGDDSLCGGDGDDTLYGNKNGNPNSGPAFCHLDGSDGDDLLICGADRDGLFGQTGNDALVGGANGEYIVAGDGNDTLVNGSAGLFRNVLVGEHGRDLFVLEPESGNTVIEYLSRGQDLIGLAGGALRGSRILRLVDLGWRQATGHKGG